MKKQKSNKFNKERYEKFKMYEQDFEEYMKERKKFKVYKENEERFYEYLSETIMNEFFKHIDEFEKFMGYGKEDITRIGIRKFVEKMGWTCENQVLSWKTDRAHIVPCVECSDDFAIFEMDFGLCNNCKEKYDLIKMQTFLEASFNAGDMDKYLLDVAMITQDKEVRSNFLKEAK